MTTPPLGVPGSPDGPPKPQSTRPDYGPVRPIATSDTTTKASNGNTDRDGSEPLGRALVAAAIERYRQHGVNIGKRLDVDKAKAGAHKVTEARTTTVNRAEKNTANTDHRSNRQSNSQSQRKHDGKAHSTTNRDRKDAASRDTKQHDLNKHDRKTDQKNTSNRDRKGTSGRDVKRHDLNKSDRKTDSKHTNNRGGDTAATSGGKHKPTPAPKAPSSGDAATKTDKTPGPATKPSREAGYRDGHRASKAAAHVKAWRDGTRDGRTHAREQYETERDQLDKARAERRRQRDEPTRPIASSKPNPSPQDDRGPVRPSPASKTAPQPPHGKEAPAVPIQVTAIDKDGVTLGNGSDRTRLTRGEVRTMKQLERHLEGRARHMTGVAERTKGLAVHAASQAQRCTALLEQARQVDGGASLLPTLERLAENAQAQAAKADEISRQAMRSAEAAAVVLANVKVRDGAIYQAVVDSPETRPAEMAFYKEGGS